MIERSPFHKEVSHEALQKTALPEMETPEESIPRSLVPWNRDDDRSRYLGLRSSGFTVREALGLIGKAKSTLSLWRHDPVFLDLENNIPELRKTLALEYASLEFLRNYRLILEKDFRVIKGSLTRKTIIDDKGNSHVIPQESQDFQYLLKARVHYTPQQLQAIEQLFSKGNGKSEEFNWTDFVLTMSRTKETIKEEVKIGTRHRQESQLATLEEDLEDLPSAESNSKE